MKPIRSLEALSEEPLCTRCLGRCFAKLGHGLTNEERGKLVIGCLKGEEVPGTGNDGSIKEEYSVFIDQLKGILPAEGPGADDGTPKVLPDNIDNIPADDCWLCEGISAEVDEFSKILIKQLTDHEFSNFLVGSKIDDTLSAREEALWEKAGVTTSEPIKVELNREVGKRLNEALGKPTEFTNPDMVCMIDTRFNTGSIQPSPIFIYGRYRKLSRGLPQTRWHCRSCRGRGCSKCGGTGKMYETSVEELIGTPFAGAAGAEEFYLHGMGREDIDVLMLGTGRPFVLELSRPRLRTLDLEMLAGEINENNPEAVEISGLRLSTRSEMVAVKMSKSFKTYRCTIIGESTIPDEKLKMVVNTFVESVITQKTPIRVAHRRADKVRKKKVADCKIESVGGTEFALDIKAESGLYIKELIHGDSGRTRPNLSDELGVKCQVKELDVIQIHDDEPE